MSRMRSAPRVRLLAVAIAVAALVSTILVGANASNAASGPALGVTGSSPIDWVPCGDGFECATFRVPLDYDRPNGAKISLALIRLPATVPGQRIGSLFMNPGGPGG